jgi:hypothetical protein
MWRRIEEVEIWLHAFFDLGTRWLTVVRFTIRPLYPQGKTPRYPLDTRLGGPQSLSGRSVEDTNFHAHRESNPDHSIIQPLARRYTELSPVIMWVLNYNNDDDSSDSNVNTFIVSLRKCRLVGWLVGWAGGCLVIRFVSGDEPFRKHFGRVFKKEAIIIDFSEIKC